MPVDAATKQCRSVSNLSVTIEATVMAGNVAVGSAQHGIELLARAGGAFPNETVTFAWSEANYPDTLQPTLQTQSPTSPWLQVPKLNSSRVYHFFVQASQTGRTVEGSIHVRAGGPPAGGSCLVHPANGTAFNTSFAIDCSGWSSDAARVYSPGPPLQFSPSLGSGPDTVSTIIFSVYNQSNQSVTTMDLGSFGPGKYNLSVLVSDRFGSVSVDAGTVRVDAEPTTPTERPKEEQCGSDECCLTGLRFSYLLNSSTTLVVSKFQIGAALLFAGNRSAVRMMSLALPLHSLITAINAASLLP